ncbi:zinc binding domain containing protein 598 protein [Babesia ovis]|uniref:Zinc binding domain containing protein 598 protein n=1 Tax=Babesia ovis TaxID=5869 RepID=A0A9W5TE10_BABOV|nr:zinc binding domain containing protein 598 protein [Babesia ovis]
MVGGRRFPPRSGAAKGTTSRNHAPTSSDSGSTYTLFRESLQDAILSAYLQSKVSRLHDLSREQLEAVAQKSVSEHFHGYLCCSICYENALICAVGTCTHVMCFLCMLRLKNFYDDCNVYQCPYCKQESDFLALCANPFFTHICLDSTLYSYDGTPELSVDGLEKLLDILGADTSTNRSILSKDQVNMRDLHNIFIESAKNMSVEVLHSSDKNIQRLLQKTQQLSIEKREQREPFHDVYNIRHPRPYLHGEMVVVSGHRLLFENSSIYMLFRAVSTALCWAPECKSLWHPTMPLATNEEIEKAVSNLYTKRYSTYMSLNRHLKSKHGVVICDVCQGYFRLKKFICEMPLYRLQDIKTHLKQGDPERIPAIPPHMLCSACNRLQWDLTELKTHAKTDHFFCNLCDSEGAPCEVYTDYGTLFDHFKTYHYPCEEQDCMFVVFPDDLQLHLHYMSKHPHRQRTSSSRKPKVPLNPPENDSTDVKTTQYMCQLPTNSIPWDGNIRIIKESTHITDDRASSVAQMPVSKEFEDWMRKHPYLEDTQQQIDIDRTKELLDAFVRTLINLNLDPTVREYDYDTFNVKCAIRVMSDLCRALDILKAGTFPPRSDILDLLPTDFQRRIVESLDDLRSKYECVIESSISGEVSSGQHPTLLDVVKGSLVTIVVFVYSIDLYECVKLPRTVRAISEEHRLSPNGLILFNALDDMIQSTNRILMKQAFDWMVTSLKDSISRASEMKQPSISLASMVKPKTKTRISLEVFEKGRSIAKEIGQQKQQKRQQRIFPHLEPKPSAWGKVTQAASKPAEESSSASAPEPTEIVESQVLENDSYVVSVEDCFKQSLNVDFLTAMISVIKSALMANATKYQATSTEYRLRGTTRMKLDQLVMAGPRRFTLLSEFVPMQVLESLQALEPEFHRLVKEAKHADIDTLAKMWSSRCQYALRRCRVEHLEIIDYYLNAKTAAMALRNENDFPVLGGGGAPQPSKTRRNYAQALNIQNSSTFVLLDSEFPALG